MVDPAAPTQFQANNLDYNDYVGRLAIGRIKNGALATGLYTLCRVDGTQQPVKITQIYGWRGLKRIELASAEAGDIVAIGQPAALADLPDLRADNALARWLDEVAKFEVDDLRSRWRLAVDLDSPLDVLLVAELVKKSRDETFIERLQGGARVNMTPAIFSLGGATLDNEWNHIQQKLMRGLGIVAIENQARAAGAGLWRNPRFRVRSADEAGRALGSFQLIEGRVLAAARRGDRWYLNFGEDWRSDFTVVIPARALPDFAAAKIDPWALKGRVIRVRGWVESFNGPMIEAVIPEQIELIEEPAP